MDPLDPREPTDPIEDDDDDDDDELPRPAWYDLDTDEATAFLQNRVAQLNEAFVEDDEGVIWAYRYHVMERAREVDAVVLLWLITSDEALETLEGTLRRSDVNKYFDWSVIGGPQNNAPTDILGAFLGPLLRAANEQPRRARTERPRVRPERSDGLRSP